MTLVWGRRRPRHERSSATPSVALSVTLPDSSPPPKSGDKLFDKPTGPLGTKPPVANAPTATGVPKYSKDDLQRIFKAVLEARAPAPIPASTLVLALAPILAPAPVLAPTPILAPVPVLTPTPVLAPAPIVAKAPRKKLKACSPDVYYGKSHIDCYNFYQQYEDYFAIVGATRSTRILYATSFLQDQISFRWQ